MFEDVGPPLILFKTLKNTELGAGSVELADDGSVVLRSVMKKVTESMLVSYPRSALGKWTPNREAVRYTREELAGREVVLFEGGSALDVEAVVALAG